MIDIRRTAGHRLEITVSGVMDEHDVHHLFARLDGDFDVGGEQSLLLDLRALERLTVNAHVRDLIYRTRRFGRHGMLGRVAIVGGPRRFGLRARLHGALFRELEIRRFDTASFELAERWLHARAA